MNDEEIIEGLAEIREAEAANAQFSKEFKQYARGGPRPKTKSKSTKYMEELYQRYPRATAYLYAEWISKREPSWAKEAAGKKAMDRILAGEDVDKVIADMREEIHEKILDHSDQVREGNAK